MTHENLCRSELTEAEEAQCLARRKVLWEEREANSGSTCATIPKKRGRGQPEGFATETAKITGDSKATINRKIARASKIDHAVLVMA